MSESVAPASVYRDQAIDLLNHIAASVAPGSTVEFFDGARWVGPVKCDSPDNGLFYYGVSRVFNAPVGHTGGSLIPAITEQLKSHGFTTGNQDTTGGWPSIAATTKYMGFLALGDPAGRETRTGLDTRCGTGS